MLGKLIESSERRRPGIAESGGAAPVSLRGQGGRKACDGGMSGCGRGDRQHCLDGETAQGAMTALQRAAICAVIRQIIGRAVDGAEAAVGKVRGKASGLGRGAAGGRPEGEARLGEQGENAENSGDQPAPGMAVSRRISQFGYCQPGASHVITIAGAADWG